MNNFPAYEQYYYWSQYIDQDKVHSTYTNKTVSVGYIIMIMITMLPSPKWKKPLQMKDQSEGNLTGVIFNGFGFVSVCMCVCVVNFVCGWCVLSECCT